MEQYKNNKLNIQKKMMFMFVLEIGKTLHDCPVELKKDDFDKLLINTVTNPLLLNKTDNTKLINNPQFIDELVQQLVDLTENIIGTPYFIEDSVQKLKDFMNKSFAI